MSIETPVRRDRPDYSGTGPVGFDKNGGVPNNAAMRKAFVAALAVVGLACGCAGAGAGDAGDAAVPPDAADVYGRDDAAPEPAPEVAAMDDGPGPEPVDCDDGTEPGAGDDVAPEPADEPPDAAGDIPVDMEGQADAPGDADAPPGPPPRPRVTVGAIPDSMNGKEPCVQEGAVPLPFRLRVPTGGFTVEAYLRPGDAWTGHVRIVASVPVMAGGGTVEPGEDLVPHLACGHEPDPAGWADDEALLHTRCALPASAIAPAEGVTFTASLADDLGATGEHDAITVDVASLPPHLDPFPATDVWVVVLTRDLFANEVVAGPDGTYEVTSTYLPQGDGEPDLDQALRCLGLLSDNEAFSAAVRQEFLDRVRETSYAIYGLDAAGGPLPGGVDLRMHFEGDAGAPDWTAWTAGSTFSRIALGGDPDPAGIAAKYVGMAAIDPNNQGREDDAKYNRGVFVTSIVRQALGHPFGAQILKEISPLDGTPLGMYPGDEDLLDPSFDPASSGDDRLVTRATILDFILEFAPMAVASTLCHEMGHSLGLVPNGPPPEGLFGGMPGLSFSTGDPGSWHVDTPGLNVMQTGKVTNWLEALGAVPRFEPLSMAYLRRQLVVGTP
jgi:hypothetical protein